jgi:hypothetical protein
MEPVHADIQRDAEKRKDSRLVLFLGRAPIRLDRYDRVRSTAALHAQTRKDNAGILSGNRSHGSLDIAP